MKHWQWGIMMLVLCNIAYHVSDKSLEPLIFGGFLAFIGVMASVIKQDFL